jgi:hypothetical protein
MAKKQDGLRPDTIWAYGYRIDPPQAEARLSAIRALLDEAKSDARSGARIFEGRFLREQQVTHILVVSDSPDQNRAVNQKLEAALKELSAEFSITAPMAVASEAHALPPATGRPAE